MNTLANKTLAFLKNSKWYIVVSLYGVLLLSLCSKNSPMFYFNDWVDANSFFTVGKSLFNNITLYRDIFEQKGPMLYFLHGLGYLVTPTSFTGVFIVESLVFSVFIIYVYKILKLFTSETLALLGSIILPVFILGAFFFCQGGSAEEYIMCAQTVSLYYMLYYMRHDYPNKQYNKYHMLVHGIMFAITLLIKYNIAIFWFIPICTIGISLLINKQYRDTLNAVLMFITGSCIVLLPWVIYFLANGALADFVEIYFLFNIKYYATKSAHITGVVSFFLSVYRNGLYLLGEYTREYIAMIVGIVYLVFFMRDIKWWHRISIAASIGLLYSAIFFNSTGYRYYSMGVIFCAIFGVLALCRVVQCTKIPVHRLVLIPIAVIMFALTLSANPYHEDSRLFQRQATYSKVQQDFANIMHETDNPTLLNHGFLDGGFYTVADIMPTVKYFQRQNQIYETYPEHRLEHERYIRESVTDYIVRRCKKDYYPDKFDTLPYLEENYELVAQQEQFFEGFDFIYFLYRVRP